MVAIPQQVQSKPVLKQLWHVRCAEPSPLAVAAQLGWLHHELRDDGIAFGTLQESTTAGVSDLLSIRQGDSAHAIWSRAKGSNTRVIGLHWTNEYQAILALPDSGIRTAADLRGRRLGLPKEDVAFERKRAAALRGFAVTLQQAGIDPRTADFVDVAIHAGDSRPTARDRGFGNYRRDYDDVVRALCERRIDAIFVQGPQGIGVTDALKAVLVSDLRTHPDPLARANSGGPRPITIDARILEARPDLVARLLTRVVAVSSWAATHPLEAVACIASQTGSHSDYVRRAYGMDLHTRHGTDLDPTGVMALHTYKNFLFEWGLLPENFDIDGWIDPRPLEAVRAALRRRTIRAL
jgi:ABC-type nitrate/sulfonate/bicarbonate transport system substrate-binding protein